MDALFFACCLGNLENIKGWCLDTQMKRRERERDPSEGRRGVDGRFGVWDKKPKGWFRRREGVD